MAREIQGTINFLTGDPHTKKNPTNDNINEMYVIGSMTNELEKKFEKWIEEEKSFGKWSKDLGNFTYQLWNNLRIHDGVLCRKDSDCSWIDENLVCYEPTYMNLIPNVSTYLIFF